MDQYIVQKSGFDPEDIRQIVAIHCREIGQGFLSSLGDKALDLIFSLAIESESGVLLVAKDTAEQGRVCGFILGTTDTGAFYKDFLLKKSFSAVVFLAPKLLSFEKLRKAFETLFYPSRDNLLDLPDAELFDIAVNEQYKGSGLAQLLFREFVIALCCRGVESVKITTGEELTRAQRFYEKLGAEQVASTEVHRGQRTLVYIYDIARTTASPAHS